MKKYLLTILVALAFSSGVALADTTGSAEAAVFVIVNPNVGVGVITPLVNLGSVQTGEFSGEITFRVDANVQLVGLNVAVSNLYKDDVATSPHQIPVLLSAGVVIVNTTEIMEQPAGSDNVLQYQGAVAVGPYLGQVTETEQFSAGQDGRLSQNVVVKPSWTQPDDELPEGEYSGLVILTAVI
jgi:hypothetical protein